MYVHRQLLLRSLNWLVRVDCRLILLLLRYCVAFQLVLLVLSRQCSLELFELVLPVHALVEVFLHSQLGKMHLEPVDHACASTQVAL